MKHYRLGMMIPHRIGRWEYTLQFDGSVCLHAYLGNTSELHIPETLMGRPVTGVGPRFRGPEYLQLVFLPSTVTRIGEKAFSFFEHLKGVWIPAETTDIHETAFDHQDETILFTPEGSAAHAYAREHGLEYEPDVLPAFEEDDCTLISGDWSCEVTQEGNAVLLEYTGQEARVEIPAQIQGHPLIGIANDAFHGNDFLEEVTVPEGVEFISGFAFAQCNSLRRVHLPDSLMHLASGVFCECTDLEEINLPPSIELLQMCTFSSCASLRTITLPQSMRIIFSMAFGGCTSLEEIRLNDGLKSVVGSAFFQCPRLRRPAELPDTLDEEGRDVLSALPC